MFMKLRFVPLLAGVLVLATGSAPAQDTRSGVPGVLRSDGTFRPFVLRATTPPAGGKEVTGTFAAALTITLVTSFPEGTTLQCGLSTTATGESSGGMFDEFIENATVNATVNGSTATCSPTIPYEWLLYATGDQVSVSYSITAINSSSVGRLSQGSIATITVPATGTVTRYKVKTRI
jgi:hypothetical protein